MNVTEKIREAIRLHRTVPGQSAQDVGRCVTCDVPAMYWHAAEAVVAAFRAMTPSEQAELLDGHVESEYLPSGVLSDQRAVGPWREA